jgi:hypothetical protein
MTLFVINVGETIYGKKSIKFIESLCDYNNINLFILDKNIKENVNNVHPSWLKLFAFNYVNDDFIITWDLDLVPTKLYKISDYFNNDEFNFAYDRGYIYENFTFNGKFKYNCGLMGIPIKYRYDLEKLYHDKSKYSTYPSFEQYHVNDYVFDNNVKVHLLEQNLNHMFGGSEIYPNDVLNIHYTGRLKSEQHRIELIDKHYETYKHILNL